MQWSQSGEAEKRPIECTSAGAGDRATWQRAGKTSRHCESRHWAENRVFITKGLFYRGGGILPWKFMIAYPSSSFLHQRNQIFLGLHSTTSSPEIIALLSHSCVSVSFFTVHRLFASCSYSVPLLSLRRWLYLSRKWWVLLWGSWVLLWLAYTAKPRPYSTHCCFFLSNFFFYLTSCSAYIFGNLADILFCFSWTRLLK